MSIKVLALLVVIALFGILTGLALNEVGYFGILLPHFRSWGGGQVFADLCISLTLILIWLLPDAKKQGIPAWSFVLLTLSLGSSGPLFYLLLRELRSKPARA